MELSIVIPCYNSEKSISEVIELSIKEIEKIHIKDFEFILVNDCSSDNTITVLYDLYDKYSSVKIIDLAINAGQQNAIMAGLNYAKGELILCMDDDLQTHPSQISKLVKTIKENDYDLVFGVYPEYKKSLFRRLGTKFNALTVHYLTGEPKDIKTSSFYIFHDYIKNSMINYKNNFTHLRSLLFITASKIGNVEIEHFERKYGSSNYTLKKLIKLWAGCINYTVKPLRIASIIGCFASFIGFFLLIYVCIRRIIYSDVLVGWTSIISILLLFFGLILLSLGIIGEYIGRIYMCINNTPQYVIKKISTNDK